MRLEDPRDRPRIARHLQRNQITRVETLREELKRIRSGRDPPGRTQPTLRNDRHLAEIAVDIQRYRPHLSSLPSLITRENRWANDIDRSALAAQPGKSQGRPQKPPGSKPIVQNGPPNLRYPRNPSPQSTEPKPAAGHHQSPRENSYTPRNPGVPFPRFADSCDASEAREHASTLAMGPRQLVPRLLAPFPRRPQRRYDLITDAMAKPFGGGGGRGATLRDEPELLHSSSARCAAICGSPSAICARAP
jgi:hypothetical protein